MYRIPNPLFNRDSDIGKWNDVPVNNLIIGEEDFFSLQYIGFVGEFNN